MWAAPRDDRRLFVALLVALIALAWLALWVWGQSPYGRFLGHHSLEAVRGNVPLSLVFIAGWTLMVIAMMLPTSLPLVALFRTLVRGRPDRTRLTVLLIAGYPLLNPPCTCREGMGAGSASCLLSFFSFF